MEWLEGVVVQKSSRDVRVRAGDRIWLCGFRGRFRGGRRGKRDEGGEGLPIVAGDRVRFRPTGANEGVIEEILPRRNELRRARSIGGRRRRSGVTDQVVAANMDQVLIVVAARQPPPRWGLVDRVLATARYDELEPVIAVNKWDQVEDDLRASRELDRILSIYSGLEYRVIRAAALEGRGIEEIRAELAGRATVLSGHSGVGKSTIIRALCPGIDVATGEISEATGKGRHVTTAAALYELQGGGVLVDTPGYREYGVLDIPPAQLALYYPEMASHVSRCRFANCLHRHEPGCAVLEAKAKGLVSDLRYENYKQILASLLER